MEVTAFCTQTLPSEHMERRSEDHQMFFFSFSKKGRKEKNSKLRVQLKAGVPALVLDRGVPVSQESKR